jgi:hypothetical protein
MQGPLHGVEFTFQPIDLASQPIAFLPQPVPPPSQPLDFVILPFKLGDQVITRGGAPARSHPLVMPRFITEYKRKVMHSRRAAIATEGRTR